MDALNQFREDCREFNEADLREGLSKLLPESNLTRYRKRRVDKIPSPLRPRL